MLNSVMLQVDKNPEEYLVDHHDWDCKKSKTCLNGFQVRKMAAGFAPRRFCFKKIWRRMEDTGVIVDYVYVGERDREHEPKGANTRHIRISRFVSALSFLHLI